MRRDDVLTTSVVSFGHLLATALFKRRVMLKKRFTLIKN